MLLNVLAVSDTCQAEAKPRPDIDFLEFLGEGVIVEGEYLDPLTYTELEQSGLASIEAEQKESSVKQEVNDHE